MTERLWVQFLATPQRPFFMHHSFWSKHGNLKLERKLTWHSCMCCIPAKGRVDIEEFCWLIKSISMVAMIELRACQPTETNVPQKFFLSYFQRFSFSGLCKYTPDKIVHVIYKSKLFHRIVTLYSSTFVMWSLSSLSRNAETSRWNGWRETMKVEVPFSDWNSLNFIEVNWGAIALRIPSDVIPGLTYFFRRFET